MWCAIRTCIQIANRHPQTIKNAVSARPAMVCAHDADQRWRALYTICKVRHLADQVKNTKAKPQG